MNDIVTDTGVKTRWESGKESELAFWREWCASKGLQWPEDYHQRLDAALPVQEYIRECLQPEADISVSILDVGAGPLTSVGKVWPGHAVALSAVDALADDYNQILDEFGVVPPVRTQPGEVERLSECFPPEAFDLVHMRNALDHSYDPILGIRQMLHVVKSGGTVLLGHYLDEGEGEHYAGLHQWNIAADDGRFVVWNASTRLSVDDVLGDLLEALPVVGQEGAWLTVRLIKSRRATPASRRESHATTR